ncbi:hypothetical protein KEM55_003821, partial [Ascosphaera atra]
MATDRLQAVLSQLKPATGGSAVVDKICEKKPDDVVITLALRTPLTKGFKGGLKDSELDYIIYILLKQVLERSNLKPEQIEDVVVGNVSRIALAVGIGNTVTDRDTSRPTTAVQPGLP